MWISCLTILLLCLLSCINGQRDRIKIDPKLTMDQIILRAMGGTNKVANSLTMPDPDKQLAELDMVLTKKQFDSMYAPTSGRSKRKAVVDETVYWTNGRVPYKFKPGDFNAYDQWMLKVAMREWEKYTCIRFHEAGPSDSNYIYFQDGLGCNSQLGMVGGVQTLNLDKAGCRFKGLYLHEIAHALGVVHEHQRPIRDKYISIIYANVEPSMKIWFQKYNPAAINSYNVDYELSSVMHYGITAFSRGNNRQTIRAKDPSREEEIGRVYAKELSFTDVEIVNRMYKCVSEPNDCESKRCSGKGYLDQNCECLCPDGSHDCLVNKPQDNSCSNNGDIRDNWLCYMWARQGECDRNPGYMSSRCAKACGQCGDERKDLADVELCIDVYDEELCAKWKDEVGDCRVAEHFMKKYCKRTCGYCNDFTLNRTPPQTLCANAYTNDTACMTWARKGECVVNDRWMPLNCRKACFTCEFDDTSAVTVKPSGSTSPTQPTHSTRTTRPTTRPPVITTVPTTRKPIEDCVNRYPDGDCDIWAKYDHCNINPTFMEANCMRSCGVCRDTGTGTDITTRSNGGTDPMDNCKDTWKNPSLCELWAEYQHCVINPSFMLKSCAKSCRSCTAGIREAAAQIIQDSEHKRGNGTKTIVGSLLNLIVMLLSFQVLY